MASAICAPPCPAIFQSRRKGNQESFHAFLRPGQVTTSVAEEDINVKDSSFKSLNRTSSLTNASTHGRSGNSRPNKGNSEGDTIEAHYGAIKTKALQPSQSQQARPQPTSLVTPTDNDTHINSIYYALCKHVLVTCLEFNGKNSMKRIQWTLFVLQKDTKKPST
ncbi:hypothetical protein K0M31_012577 [Melipona bicolor]|uniref:Uncharacterized protein n=1 Tax=Melipona bicolor TaxID=60889 RepID=A0AA40FJY5_9HYME|nr:hypothetical protein K0M31_012577 [Melipona bicolor]